MKRFFILCVLLATCWLGNIAESIAAEDRLIAVIMANSQQRYQDIHAVFVDNARTFCDDHCRIYVQTPNADIMSLRNSVRKATALGADLIVTYGPAASLAAKTESSPVPTIFADVYDPVKLKLVSAKSLTGRNMTGIRGDAPIQALFKYFVEAIRAETLAVLFDTGSPVSTLQKAILEDRAKKKGMTTILLPVDSQMDHLKPLQALPADIDGLFLASSEHTETQLLEILAFAATRQLPVMTQHAGTAELGAFMVLQTSIVEQGEKLAEIAGQVLAGKKASGIPMYKPRQVEFVVNLKIAREYGIHVPLQTLSVASRVVR